MSTSSALPPVFSAAALVSAAFVLLARGPAARNVPAARNAAATATASIARMCFFMNTSKDYESPTLRTLLKDRLSPTLADVRHDIDSTGPVALSTHKSGAATRPRMHPIAAALATFASPPAQALRAAFQAPRVKSGNATGALPFATDSSLRGAGTLQAAPSYTFMSGTRPFRRHSTRRQLIT